MCDDEKIIKCKNELTKVYRNVQNITTSDINYCIFLNGVDIKKCKKYLNHLDYMKKKEKKYITYVDSDRVNDYLPFLTQNKKNNKNLLDKK